MSTRQAKYNRNIRALRRAQGLCPDCGDDGREALPLRRMQGQANSVGKGETQVSP